MSKHSQFASQDFSKDVLKALAKKKIFIHNATYVPGADGTYANGERAYMLDDNGTGRVRTYLQVQELAK